MRLRIVTALLCVLALLPGDADARSGGGFSSGGGSRGFSAPSPSRPSAPSYSAPRTPSYSPPSGGGNKGFSAPAQKVYVPPAPSRVVMPPPAPRVVTPPVATTPKVNPPTAFHRGIEKGRAEERSRDAFRKAEVEKQRAAEKITPPPVPPRQVDAPAIRERAQERPTYTERSRVSSPRVVERHYYQNDGGISPWFWMWLMSQNSHSRDDWVYHNRDRISLGQMDELRQKDREIDRRLSSIEENGVSRNPSAYVTGIDDRAPRAPRSSFWMWAGGAFLLGGMAYLIFFHRFSTRRTA